MRFVAERVHQLREERGLTQEALAVKAGVSAKYIGEVERAITSVSVETLWKVCDGLGLSIVEFFAAGEGGADEDVAAAAALLRAQAPVGRAMAMRLLRALCGGQ